MLFRSATSRNIFGTVALGLISTIAAATVLFSLAYTHFYNANIEEMKTAAEASANGIETTLIAAAQTVQTMEMSISSLRKDGSGTRESVVHLMEEVLSRSPFAFGVSTGWDPESFDGKDKDYIGKPLHDKTGRFLPYVYRSGNGIGNDVLTGYDQPGAGDYYILPHDTGKMILQEPYFYAVDGKDVLMTTVAVPTRVADKIVGVVTIDIDLNKTANELSEKKPLGDGYIALVTSNDMVVSHPDRAMMGKPLAEGKIDVATWKKILSNPGQTMEVVEPNGEIDMAVAVPVTPFEGAKWYAVVSAPKATVFADLNKMVWMSIATIVVATLLLGSAGWLIARRFIRRIENVIGQTTEIAKGNLGVVLTDREKNDELGDLSRSLGVLLDASRQKVQLEKDAEVSRANQESERAEHARIANAQEEEVKFAVTELAAGLTRLADGDMTARLSQPFTAALDQIRENFNDSVEKLQEAMLSFSDNARTIQSGSEEIRSAADSLARRTEQQAASVEETAAALEEITTSVKDSTTRAEDASSLVARTKQGAEHSGNVVRDAVSAMSAIEQSSQSISNIIGVIDDIAFQTNLLALNAGVEAARAGDAGKGFAVVAQEVRELAQRSATAAKEIKALITSSGEQVKRGVSLVGQTGTALETIAQQVQEINTNVVAIVQAAREQSTGLQEINSAVNQMDQATQQNAAMVEESNAASHTLVTEVSSLSSRLGQFNLGRPQAKASATTHAPAPVSRQTSRPTVAAPSQHPTPSPARALTAKVSSAFGGANAVAKSSGGEWEEF